MAVKEKGSSMRDKLVKMIAAYGELEKKMGDPAVIADQKEYQKLAKEFSDQAALIAKARAYVQDCEDLEEAKEMLDDPEMKEFGQEEIARIEAELPELEDEIKVMLIPADPADEKDIIVEIRGGAGGDEAAIFAGDLYKMYQRFCEQHRWKIELMDSSPSEAGGYKSIQFKVKGDKVYSIMKFESGVHRVQRVPKTESQGRIHTSTATVAVLPEADEIDVQINQEDLRIDVYRAGGPAASALTRPTPPCASRTCRPASSCSRRTRRASCRTRPRPWKCSARACTTRRSRSSVRPRVPSAAARSGMATAPRRSAPTTARRTA